MERLWLSNTSVSDISVLAGMTYLELIELREYARV